MSLNTAHTGGGVLLHQGEYILLFSDKVEIEFIGRDDPIFKGTKEGRIYLTSHRMIFNNKKQNDSLQSFSFPFVALSDVEIEQPIFGANYIKGKVRAQPNGNWTGEAKFKLVFKSGGAIEYGQAMLRAAKVAQQQMNNDAPPPYVPPSSNWYQAPPEYYQPPPNYYGWLPQTDAFSGYPSPNTVFISPAPPPYPGINVPQTGPMPNQGYPQAPGNAAPNGPYMGFNGATAGYPTQNNNAGASGSTSNYGFQNPKEMEAARSAYYDPNAPQTAYAPPPPYYDPAPSYHDATGNKKNQ